MRQLAWLNAVPEPSAAQKSEPDTRSRMERLKDKGETADFPEVSAEHVIGYFLEAGPTLPGGMGPAALTHSEIAAWQANTGIELSAWEACALRQLSREYVAELCLAVKADRPAPYMPSGARYASVADDLKAAMKRRAAM